MSPDTHRLRALQDAGQSVWLDFLSRGLITGGGLARLIDEDGVTGVTSNPTIFAKAMVGSNELRRRPRPHRPPRQGITPRRLLRPRTG